MNRLDDLTTHMTKVDAKIDELANGHEQTLNAFGSIVDWFNKLGKFFTKANKLERKLEPAVKLLDEAQIKKGNGTSIGLMLTVLLTIALNVFIDYIRGRIELDILSMIIQLILIPLPIIFFWRWYANQQSLEHNEEVIVKDKKIKELMVTITTRDERIKKMEFDMTNCQAKHELEVQQFKGVLDLKEWEIDCLRKGIDPSKE